MEVVPFPPWKLLSFCSRTQFSDSSAGGTKLVNLMAWKLVMLSMIYQQNGSSKGFEAPENLSLVEKQELN